LVAALLVHLLRLAYGIAALMPQYWMRGRGWPQRHLAIGWHCRRRD
jgi:hypothetical protein